MTSLATIHVGKKALGLDDDTYRALLLRITGQPSAKGLNDNQQIKVIEEMRRLGFKKTSKPVQKRLQGKYAAKLQSLWIAGWNLGIITDRTDKAMIAFVQRQTGIDHVRFVRDHDDAMKSIEALKAWLGRRGVDWKVDKTQADYQQAYGYKIAIAQWFRLHGHDQAMVKSFQRSIEDIAGLSIQAMHDGDWIIVMNKLGHQIRKAQKDGRL